MTSSKAPALKIKTLVVLGSTVTALAVVREAHKLGLKVVLIDDISGVAFKSKYPRKIKIAEFKIDEVLSSVKEFGSEPLALIADSDRWLRFIALYFDRLRPFFTDIFHPEPNVLKICLDKVHFLKWCHENDFPAPRLYDSNQKFLLCEEVTFPVIIRPKETLHGGVISLPKALEITNASDLQNWLEIYHNEGVEPIICESALVDDVRQLSVCLAVKNTQKISFVTEKIRPAAHRCRGGSFVVTASDKKAQIIAEQVIDALNFHGIAEVEILYSPRLNRYWLIEVNARPWVQFPIASAAGHNLLAFCLGAQTERRIGDKSTYSWLWFAADFYNRHDVCLYPREIKRMISADSYAFWDTGDLNPFFYEIFFFGFGLFKSSFRKIVR